MALSSAFLILLASLFHATWNLLAKRAAATGPMFVCAYAAVGTLVFAPWVGWEVLHGGMPWSAAALGMIGLSALIHLAYSLCLQRGYQVADLSVVYPVARGTGPMLATIGAILLLHEMPTRTGLAGLALVIGGIVLIATHGDLSAFRRPEGHAGVRWGAMTGALIAIYTVCDAWAVKRVGVDPVVLDWGSNLLRFLMLVPIAARDSRGVRLGMKGQWGLAAAVGVLSPLAYILVLMALRAGAPLSLAAPMRELSMMVGALLGLLILREPVGAWRFAGCGLLAGGVILLSAA